MVNVGNYDCNCCGLNYGQQIFEMYIIILEIKLIGYKLYVLDYILIEEMENNNKILKYYCKY